MIDLALRRQVAEAKGWVGVYKGNYYNEAALWGIAGGSTALIPAYETDIAAAWELLEGLDYFVAKHENGHEAVILHNDEKGMSVAISDTAPTAICKAYLKYKNEMKAHNESRTNHRF